MPYVVIYLLSLLALFTYGGISLAEGSLPASLEPFKIILSTILVGGVGGVVYCLRAAYITYCVKKSWDHDWLIWYLLRPIVSCCCGGVSYLFLKAGLLVLEAGAKDSATEIGFYAFAFIAGLNVDKFMAKIEDVAKSLWGIEKSRSSERSESE